MNERAMEILKVFNLDQEAGLLAGNLPYGKQRKLEIARALATDPKLLLLDEPAAGMNPNETMELMNTIRFVRDQFDMTILLIEHEKILRALRNRHVAEAKAAVREHIDNQEITVLKNIKEQ